MGISRSQPGQAVKVDFVSTYLIVLLLGYSKKEFVDAKREKQVKRYILLFVIATIVPSIYTAYNVVLETLFTKNANNFIHNELAFENTQVINSKLVFNSEKKRIEVTLFGEPIDSLEIDERKQKLEKYNLNQAELVIRQGLQREKGIDIATIEQMNLQLKTGIIEELYKKNEDLLKSKNDQIKLLENEIIRYRSEEIPINDLTKEIKAFTKNISQLSVASAIISDIDSLTYDTVHLAYIQFKSKPRKSDLAQIESWLKARLKVEKVKLISNPN